jgi:hypothetical protein
LAGVVLVGLCSSAVALASAPALMPPTYSWISHTTSESAAQGVSGANAYAWYATAAIGIVRVSAASGRDRSRP